ncbi:MAG: hypothetical protein KA797_01895 [Chitinophagales bacterium]|nr:hypothetical protein [Chitinophagales bacterium]
MKHTILLGIIIFFLIQIGCKKCGTCSYTIETLDNGKLEFSQTMGTPELCGDEYDAFKMGQHNTSIKDPIAGYTIVTKYTCK